MLIVDGGGQDAIEQALSQAKPGDTILVRAGNYDDNDPLEDLEISVSGSPGAPITLLGENRPRLGTVEFKGSHDFVLEGFEIADQIATSFFIALPVRDSHNIIIRDMLIHHLTGSAITTVGQSNNITIENSKLYEIVPGGDQVEAHCLINGTAQNVTFRNNECYGFIGDGHQAYTPGNDIPINRGTTVIEGNKIYSLPEDAPCSENAVDLKGELGSVIIRHNIFHGFAPVSGEGCEFQASGSPAGHAITAHQGSQGVLLIENNEFYDMYSGISGGQMDTTIRNNIFHDFKEGLVLWEENAQHMGVILATETTKVYHNTFVNTPFIFHEYASGGHQAINNIFYNATGSSVSAIAGSYSHNSWFNVNATQTILTSGDIAVDPRLDLDPDNNLPDYSLLADSPLINQGETNLEIITDFTGAPNIRALDGQPDIGAYEFTGSATTPEPTPSPTPAEPPVSTPTLQPPIASTPPASGDTITLEPVADSYVHTNESGANFGSAPGLEIDGSPTKIAYLKFDLSGLPTAQIVSARLRLFVEDSSTGTQNIKLTESNWSETELTFENRPASLTEAMSVLNGGNAGNWIEADLTTIIEPLSGQILSLSIDSTSVHGLGVKSREAGENQPHLLITLDTSAPTPTPEPTDEPTAEPTDEPTPEPTSEPTDEPTVQPTSEPTAEPTPEPTGEPTAEPIILKLNQPATVNQGETFTVSLEAENVSGAGIYGFQLELNYDPNLLSAGNLQLNPDFTFVVLNEVDNPSGQIRLAASRQGQVAGLSGEVTLLSFEATAGQTAGEASVVIANEKLSDPAAQALEVITEAGTVTIGETGTPEPTVEPTSEPTAEPTDEPTPEPTDEPTPEPTDEPTPEPTDEPTPEPTDEPTPEPTDEPTPEPTAEPTDEPTPEPTDEPTAEPTDEPTPEPTGEPFLATVSGQAILAGRSDNNWSGAQVTLEASSHSATTDAGGLYSLNNVEPGTYSAIQADASGYLPAVCEAVTVAEAEESLAVVTLLSGDLNDDDLVDITDAAMVGTGFGTSGAGLAADLNLDEVVDIFDIVLVSLNFGTEGPQAWSCQ